MFSFSGIKKLRNCSFSFSSKPAIMTEHGQLSQPFKKSQRSSKDVKGAAKIDETVGVHTNMQRHQIKTNKSKTKKPLIKRLHPPER